MQQIVNQINEAFGRDLVESAKTAVNLMTTPIKNPLLDFGARVGTTLFTANKFASWIVREKIASCAGFPFNKFQLVKDLSAFTSKLAAEKWDVIGEKLCLTACKTAQNLESVTPVNCSVATGSMFKNRCFTACLDPTSYSQGFAAGAANLAVEMLIDRIAPEQPNETRLKRVLKFTVKSASSAGATFALLTYMYRASLGDIAALWMILKVQHTAAQTFYNYYFRQDL